VLALAGNKLGMRNLMAVGCCRLVILTMIIERFFIVIEESGLREGLQMASERRRGDDRLCHYQLGGPAANLLRLPELLAAVAALQVILGRYTGYRSRRCSASARSGVVMIGEVFRRLREAGVLGINSRNATTSCRCNARSSYPIVDDRR